MTDIYFFANIGSSAVDTYARLRGKFTTQAWDPHTGKISVPEFPNSVEDGQSVTIVRLNLTPVHSLFITAKQ